MRRLCGCHTAIEYRPSSNVFLISCLLLLFVPHRMNASHVMLKSSVILCSKRLLAEVTAALAMTGEW
jgi:hypothetical protein